MKGVLSAGHDLYNTEYSRVVSLSTKRTAYRIFTNMVVEQFIFCCIQEQACNSSDHLSIIQHLLLIAHWSDSLLWMPISLLRDSAPSYSMWGGRKWKEERLSLRVFSLQSSESGKWLSNCCAQIAEPSTRAAMCTYFGDWWERYSPIALKANSYAHKAFQYRYKFPKTTKSLLFIYG